MNFYSHLLKNFPQFVVTHTVKGFGIINKEKVDVNKADSLQEPAKDEAFKKKKLDFNFLSYHMIL